METYLTQAMNAGTCCAQYPPGEHEQQHDDRSQRCRRLEVHDQSAKGQPKALSNHHTEEENKQGHEVAGCRGLEARHPIGYGHKTGWEDKLHGHVASHPGHEVRGEAIHARRPLLCQHCTLLREGEDSLGDRDEAPESSAEEKQPNLLNHTKTKLV